MLRTKEETTMNSLGWLLCLATVIVLGGGCFNPDYGAGGFACLEGQCPEGYACVGGVCRKSGSSVDLALDTAVLDGPSADQGQPDGGTGDLAPDLSTLESGADLPQPDLPQPDLPWDSGQPDQAAPDLLAPDLPTPDLPAPDLAAPDLAAPDLAAPDLPAPDLGPDLAVPDATLPDSTPGDSGPSTPNIVFVTSTTVIPGALGGLSGADAVCKARATAAGLKGIYKAWLSSSTVNAPSRLAGARGWVRTDGKPVLDQASTLSTGLKWYPIDRDESGAKVSQGVVVTATSSSMSASSATCSDWTVVSSSSTSGGSASALGSRWNSGMVPRCDGSIVAPRLYCFGVDHNTPVKAPVATGRKAFLSTAKFTPGSGLAPADAICKSEATGAGLSGTFRALLATTTASALSRFNMTAGPWVRTDGLPLGTLSSNSLETSLHVHANGTSYSLGGWVWTGASNPSAVGSSSCVSWTSTSTSIKGALGSAAEPSYFFYGLALSCDRSYPVYCLED